MSTLAEVKPVSRRLGYLVTDRHGEVGYVAAAFGSVAMVLKPGTTEVLGAQENDKGEMEPGDYFPASRFGLIRQHSALQITPDLRKCTKRDGHLEPDDQGLCPRCHTRPGDEPPGVLEG